MTDQPQYACLIKRNIMGGGNVIVYDVRTTVASGSLIAGSFHVASYSSMSSARRAVRTGAAVRRAIQTEAS